ADRSTTTEIRSPQWGQLKYFVLIVKPSPLNSYPPPSHVSSDSLPPVAEEPDDHANHSDYQHDDEFILLQILQHLFEQMTEIVAGCRNSRSPEKGAAEVKADEAKGGETADTYDDRGDGPHTVEETIGKDGNNLVADKKVTNLVDTGRPPGSALQKNLPLPFPDLEEELVSGECPDKGGQDDP